ncbi:DUF523 domain-containing protein [Desulfovirgula thermocuniculi]|uniref:DUF523 domain-containing protein n=1 Tax=Desulfovirgula thermocuniculi TaxID=348842 RepID=UPI00042817D8|nr:DUF523 domain-containing protein [Desulfovirgula thermocuniculi]
MNRRYVVSACLAGEACAYDGRPRPCPAVQRLVREGRAVSVCPECLGGLPVPRPPAEIQGGAGDEVIAGLARVKNCYGEDITAFFLEGARAVLEIARRHGIKAAILKAKSPSCGRDRVYDGTFTGKLRPGHGVTAALLLAHGFEVYTEREAERMEL